MFIRKASQTISGMHFKAENLSVLTTVLRLCHSTQQGEKLKPEPDYCVERNGLCPNKVFCLLLC